MQKFIVVRGAREHNLKDITVEIPRDALTVLRIASSRKSRNIAALAHCSSVIAGVGFSSVH